MTKRGREVDRTREMETAKEKCRQRERTWFDMMIGRDPELVLS